MSKYEQSTDADNVLSYGDACVFLPEGDRVHTFMRSSFALLGADWPRALLLDAMRASPDIQIAGAQAQAMRHGLAIKHPESNAVVFIATCRRTDNADEKIVAEQHASEQRVLDEHDRRVAP